MFLSERSTQAEYLDNPGIPTAERAAAFQELDHLNTVYQFSHPFVSQLPRWLGAQRCKQLEILDIGAGTGLLGRRLRDWAGRRGWDWRFTNLDANPVPANAPDSARRVVGSALQLPFPDDHFDLVVASQMTHHLSNDELVRHWREAWRVTRDGMFICDLHRNIIFYFLLWLSMKIMGTNPVLQADALISVKRGFRRREWRESTSRAGIPGAKVWLYCGARIVLQARKNTR